MKSPKSLHLTPFLWVSKLLSPWSQIGSQSAYGMQASPDDMKLSSTVLDLVSTWWRGAVRQAGSS